MPKMRIPEFILGVLLTTAAFGLGAALFSSQNVISDFWNWTTKEAISFYTAALALFTLVLVAVSAIQIRYLIRADRIARRSSIATQRLAIATKKAAEQLPRVERAYLFVDPSASKNAGRFTVTFKVTNYGKTP